MNFKKNFVALGMTMVLFATGCQKAPEDAVVKNKNLDKMIEQAKETGGGEAELESMAEKYDTYKNSIENEKLGVTVNIDAQVQIPKTEQMSVLRVKQKKIDQQFLEDVMKALNIKQPLYDGCVDGMQTKSDIEKEIQRTKVKIAALSKDEYYEENKSELEFELDSLQESYEKAPKTVEWSKYVSNGKITSVKSMYEKDKNNEFYEWAYDLNKKGDIFYGISGEEEENKIALYVQNNEERGNCLRFFSSKNIYGDVCAATLTTNINNISTNEGMWPADRKPTSRDVLFAIENAGEISDDYFKQYTNEPATITEEQAKQTAEKFLKDVGLTDYQYSNGGLYCETFYPDEEEKPGCRTVWYFKYLRNIDGVPVNNENGSKYSDGYQGSEFVKKEWGGESIDFCINDSGIVTFNYNAPIEITENVVEKSTLKDFEKIKKTFEKMVVTSYAQNQDNGEKDTVTIKVDKVVLQYMRISEANSFDTGLLVPVWSFIGTTEYKYEKDYNGIDEHAVLLINAIDGSVIDTGLGY